MRQLLVLSLVLVSMFLYSCKDKPNDNTEAPLPLIETDYMGNVISGDSARQYLIPMINPGELPDSVWVNQLGFVPISAANSTVRLTIYPNPMPHVYNPHIRIISNNKPITNIFIQDNGSFGLIPGGLSYTFPISTTVDMALDENGISMDSKNYSFLVVTSDSCIYSTAVYVQRY